MDLTTIKRQQRLKKRLNTSLLEMADYLLLDSFTENELEGNPVSGFLGFGNLEDKGRKFEMLPERLK